MSKCNSCRYWSEMVAQAFGCGPMEALCLAENGRYSNKYTTGRMSCDKWASNHFGAVDSPPNYGEFARAAYEAEKAALAQHP